MSQTQERAARAASRALAKLALSEAVAFRKALGLAPLTSAQRDLFVAAFPAHVAKLWRDDPRASMARLTAAAIFRAHELAIRAGGESFIHCRVD